MNNREIARCLGIAYSTVKNHVNIIFDQLEDITGQRPPNQLEAIMLMVRHGWMEFVSPAKQ